VVGAQHAAVQGLQFFLSESTWDHEQLNQRRLELLVDDPATRPHDQGVLVIDDSGDRKDGRHTDHVARQYLGSVGKIDNGIVCVSSLWASERVYWPIHVVPYTPASRLAKGTRDPAFRTKPQLAVELVNAARKAGICFRAVVADCFYGDNEGFCAALGAAKVAYVLAVKPRKGVWAPEEEAHTPREAAAELAWTSPEEPGDWAPVTRRFRDGHTETWWAADAALPAAGWGPERRLRLVVATTDPATLPKLTTWYLVTNLARHGRRASPFAPADLAEVVRLYSLRNWVEQGYKQVKHELGWADFQVRSDRAIRRHWTLVCCAFSFCWRAWFAEQAAAPLQPDAQPAPAGARGEQARRHGRQARHRRLAGDAAPGARLADPLGRAGALVAGVVTGAPASPACDAA
jgi:DDE superfamily endonuclease